MSIHVLKPYMRPDCENRRDRADAGGRAGFVVLRAVLVLDDALRAGAAGRRVSHFSLLRIRPPFEGFPWENPPRRTKDGAKTGSTAKPAALPVFMTDESCESDRTLHLAAAQAAGAYGHAGRSSVHKNTNLLGVRSPGAASLAIGMADVISVYDALMADFTEFAHLSHLLQEFGASKHSVLYQTPHQSASEFRMNFEFSCKNTEKQVAPRAKRGYNSMGCVLNAFPFADALAPAREKCYNSNGAAFICAARQDAVASFRSWRFETWTASLRQVLDL